MARVQQTGLFDNPIEILTEYSPEAEVIYSQGDCMDLLAKIPPESVQLVVTSPPYNIGKEYEDSIPLNEYYAQQSDVVSECVRVLRPEGSICWQVGNYVNDGEILPLDVIFYGILKSFDLKLRNRIVWTFGHGLHCAKRFSGRYETILWFTKGDDYTFNLDAVRVPQKYPNKRYFKGPNKGELSGNPSGKNPSDIWEIPNVKSNHIEKTLHPCQFPVSLVERLVLALTDEGDTVLDPFAGVGSSCIAAIMHKRRAIGAEMVPEYVNVAHERIRLASIGELPTRPLNKPIYEPPHEPQRVGEVTEP